VSDPTNGGWSNRKKRFTVGGALAATASVITIISFLTGGNSQRPTPTPTYTTIPPSNPTSSAYLAGTGYTASVQNSIISYCEQNFGEPLSYCQCDVSWLKANVAYSLFAADPPTFEQEADSYASSPPC
jgi:hypothetical protein